MRATHQITQDPDRSQRPSGERQPPRPSFKPQASSHKLQAQAQAFRVCYWELKTARNLRAAVSREPNAGEMPPARRRGSDSVVAPP